MFRLLLVSGNHMIAETQSVRNMHMLEALTMAPLIPVGKFSSPRYKFGKIVPSCSKAGIYLLSHCQSELLNLDLEQTVRRRRGCCQLASTYQSPSDESYTHTPHLVK